MDKQQQLVEAAFNLFYQNGVNATGINSILTQSGIAKKTLYHYFSGKEALILATLEYRDTVFYHWLKGRMESVTPGADALYTLFSALDDWFHDRVESIAGFQGCYFMNVAAEFSDPHDPIHQQCAKHKRKVMALISDHVSIYCADSKNEAMLIDAVVLLKEGAIAQAYVTGDLLAANKARQVLSQILSMRS